jgi:hypothetical protein
MVAEKRVSVRLIAVGGRLVRAGLEDIGDAGTRGFGRLSSEMDLANARLGSFARTQGRDRAGGVGLGLGRMHIAIELHAARNQARRCTFPFWKETRNFHLCQYIPYLA